jgi:putative protease
MPRFNARLRADNFTEEDLPELMKFLHAHGVKGYVAFNTLIFTKELPDAETQLRLLEDSGVDAVIVQDLGLARMVKALTPGLRLHASTQMTITSPEGLEFAKQLNIDQAVLARELSLRELERFKDAHVPLEVLCMARCAWLTPASVSPASRWADAVRIVANVRRPAACRMR